MTNLAKVRKAIEIQGYIEVNVAGRPMQAHTVTVVDGTWTTDILTVDLHGYVQIKKTKAAVVARAESIIAREAEIRAAREAKAAQTAAWVMQS